MPLSRPVRVGPAGGVPEALVSARDLSSGGMFVDADREVRVGARFSVELELPGAGQIYIAQAEVAYNRETAHGAGFGVRFVGLSPTVQAAIEAEVARQTESMLGPMLSAAPEVSSDVPTLAPAPAVSQVAIPTDEIRRTARTSEPTEVEVDPEPEVLSVETAAPAEPETARPQGGVASLPPEPDISSDLCTPSELPTPEAVDSTLSTAPTRWQAFLRDLPDTASRTAPGVALLAGLAIVIVVALAAWMDGVGPAEAVAAPSEQQVASSTHKVLMGEAQRVEVEPSAPVEAAPATGPVKKPLPPLVVLDAPAPKASKAAPKPTKAAPTKAPKPTKAAPATPAPLKTPAQPAASKAKRAKALSPAARALLSEAAPRLQIALDSGTTVRKSYVLHNPERFVIDLIGQQSPLTLPPAAGAVKRVRSGRHPSFLRVVVDVDGALDAGRAEVKDGELTIQLHLR